MNISRKRRERKPAVTKTKRAPEFASIAEEAAFWDSHDLTDYFTFNQVKGGKTSKGVASKASSTLNDPKSSAKAKSIAAAALTHAKDKKKKKR